MLAPFCAKILAHAGRKEFAYKIIHRITNPIPSSEEMENSSAVSSFFLVVLKGNKFKQLPFGFTDYFKRFCCLCTHNVATSQVL